MNRTFPATATAFALTLAACALDQPDRDQLAQSAYSNQIVINEIAWMGDSTSYLREWVELHNTTSSDIDISGWTLLELDGSPSVAFGPGTTVQAGGYFVLARTSSAGARTPNDLTYSGELNNTGSGKCNKDSAAQLKLLDATGALVEHVDNACDRNVRNWYAGDNASKLTMERIDALGPATDANNWANSTVVDGTPGAPNSVTAGPGECNYPATLEITSVNIGQGDATIIATPTAIVLADTGESYWNSHADANAIDAVMLRKYGCRAVDYVILSHFQVDHVGYPGYGGLWYLVEVYGYTVGETIVRDYLANIGTTSGTYDNWVAYLATQEGAAALNPRTAVPGERIDLGNGAAITITAVDTRTVSCPGGWGSAPDLSCGGAYVTPSEVLGDHRLDASVPSENDYSVSFVVSLGDFDMFIGGDTNGENADSGFGTANHDIESYLATEVGEVDILRVNHHGSDHSSSAAFIDALSPQVEILSVGNANTYGHSRQATVDRLLGVVGGVPTRDTWIYMTERGDDGLGGCLTDYDDSYKAAAELYGRATVVSDTDGDYCTIEGGDVDIVVAADGASFTVEDDLYAAVADDVPPVFCGDGTCNGGESACDCAADCGAPPATEGLCADGFDDDCDGAVDCDDADCGNDAACAPPSGCGNGVCDAGEDCTSCASDCDGASKGKPADRFCCGDGVADAAEGDGSVCDGNF